MVNASRILPVDDQAVDQPTEQAIEPPIEQPTAQPPARAEASPSPWDDSPVAAALLGFVVSAVGLSALAFAFWQAGALGSARGLLPLLAVGVLAVACGVRPGRPRARRVGAVLGVVAAYVVFASLAMDAMSG